LKGETWEFKEAAIVFINDEFIGGPAIFLSWAENSANYDNFRPEALYTTLAKEAYVSYLNSRNVGVETLIS